MVTTEEEKFLVWWQANRVYKKKVLGYLAAGLPLGVIMAVTIFFTYFSNWYKRAVPLINMRPTGVLVVLIGLLLIIVFMVVFSARHKWEMHEQRYQELLSKRDLR
jgi:protein-S-isoprenylcysteine O-methyltransferase Ste14